MPSRGGGPPPPPRIGCLFPLAALADDEGVRPASVAIGIGLALALGTAILHLAMPPNETAADGPADPFLLVRRRVMSVLGAIGVLDPEATSWLPSESGGTMWKRLPTGVDVLWCDHVVEREPVFRGPFWQVGRRITHRVRYFGERDALGAVRLYYVVGDRRCLAAESMAPTADVVEVSGFVPDSARGNWIEVTDAERKMRWIEASGRTEPFVGD